MIFRIVAGALSIALGCYMVRQVYVATSPPHTQDIVTDPVRLKATSRRLMHGTALWEASVALVLVSLQGWDAFPNVIALVGVGVMLWFSPALWLWGREFEGEAQMDDPDDYCILCQRPLPKPRWWDFTRFVLDSPPTCRPKDQDECHRLLDERLKEA